MEHRLVFSNSLKDKIDLIINSGKTEWQQYGINNVDDLMSKVLTLLNENYSKLNITTYGFENEVVCSGQSSTYFGIINNENGIVDGYVFVIPPDYKTRSGILAQQVFPVLSGLMASTMDSKDRHISNRPIFIVNLNAENITLSSATNIISGKILGFNYVDLFGRSIENVLRENGYDSEIESIEQYNRLITEQNRNHVNELFSLDIDNHTIAFLPDRLKDGIHVNNEPYWFVLKAYAATYLAITDGYSVSMTQFNELGIGNKTLDAFRSYIEKVSDVINDNERDD